MRRGPSSRRDDQADEGLGTELIAGLTGTGTVTGLVQGLKLWLDRDQRRSVTVTARSGARRPGTR
jgi:hypothetical protein